MGGLFGYAQITQKLSLARRGESRQPLPIGLVSFLKGIYAKKGVTMEIPFSSSTLKKVQVQTLAKCQNMAV